MEVPNALPKALQLPIRHLRTPVLSSVGELVEPCRSIGIEFPFPTLVFQSPKPTLQSGPKLKMSTGHFLTLGPPRYCCAEVETSDQFFLGLKPQAMVSAVPMALSFSHTTFPTSIFQFCNSSTTQPDDATTNTSVIQHRSSSIGHPTF